MRKNQYDRTRTTIGSGRYADTPIGNVTLSYLFLLRRWKNDKYNNGKGFFRYEADKAIEEIALRRAAMKVSSRTIRAIEILEILQDEGTHISGEDIHKAIYHKMEDAPGSGRTKAILDKLQKENLIQSIRGTNGGYFLSMELSEINLSSVDRIFRNTDTNDKSRIGKNIRRKVHVLFRKCSVKDILDDKHTHQKDKTCKQ